MISYGNSFSVSLFSKIQACIDNVFGCNNTEHNDFYIEWVVPSRYVLLFIKRLSICWKDTLFYSYRLIFWSPSLSNKSTDRWLSFNAISNSKNLNKTFSSLDDMTKMVTSFSEEETIFAEVINFHISDVVRLLFPLYIFQRNVFNWLKLFVNCNLLTVVEYFVFYHVSMLPVLP